jgi:hypothetical protein
MKDAEIRTALGRVRGLVGVYLAISVLTLVGIVLLRHHVTVVTDAVWVRGSIVVASATLMSVFAARAAQGSKGAFRRLRVVSAVMVVAIVVIVAVPGVFPVWMKVDQAVCGVVLLSVVLVVNGKHLRTAFGGR